ncbi:BamA/TamA family outer membrane protein [Aridibaculum aurantiacum]|uniref:BamA/TamA family outer membrane protein n=1 Tax=Aridibaculum aurantiacum TaxID=2810307 RepID=UPI001A96D8D2|nr:BamA/TamA family outer membrane protein [Aridibaculum aurantiacum]
MRLLKAFAALFLFFLIYSHEAHAQKQNFIKRYINRLINDTNDIAKPQFFAYPTLAFSPETSWEIGLSNIYIYYTNRDTSNRLSEIYGFTFYTFEKQYGIWLDHALYSDKNNWSYIGRIRYQNFPMLFYGVGMDAPKENPLRVDALQLSVRERVLKRVYKNLYIGPEVDFQNISNVSFHGNGQLVNKPIGFEGSSNLGLGAGFIWDERHNVLNVRDGSFFELAALHYNSAFASNFTFTSLVTDNRYYIPMNKRDVLAMQLLGEFNLGQVPFNQLALMGAEGMMRGYYRGRYRDKNQLAAQAEYRLLPLPFNFTKRWGATVFASAATVFNEFKAFKPSEVVVAGGAGIRFLLFPKKDIYSRLDVAFTKEGRGIYIFIGEAF